VSAPGFRHAIRAELPAIVDLWVDAFARDPFLRWIQPDDRAWPAFGGAWMRFILDLTLERGHTYVGDPLDVAVAWIPPDVSLVDQADIERGRGIVAEHAGEARSEEAFTTIIAARGHAIEAPHWTLQHIGVRASAQSTGLGAAAVAPILEICDAEERPCGLVSSNPRNVSFYERLGFEVEAEVVTPDGAAVMRPMRRSPRRAKNSTN